MVKNGYLVLDEISGRTVVISIRGGIVRNYNKITDSSRHRFNDLFHNPLHTTSVNCNVYTSLTVWGSEALK
jgi:hypothetical protein